MAYNKLSSPQSLDLTGMIDSLDDDTLKQVLAKIAEFCTLLRSDITSQEYGATRLNSSIDDNSVVDTTVPILKGLNIRTSSGGLIEWSAGTILYNGTTYNITAGTLDNTYAYWDDGDTTLSGIDTITVSDLSPTRFWLCQRIDGTVYVSPIAPISITGLAQAGTVFANHTYTGNLIVGDRTGLTTGTGMYSSGSSGDWSVGDGTDAYIKFDADGGVGGTALITIGGNVLLPASGGSGNVTYYQSSAPSGAEVGDIWYDTDGYSLYRYNGASWDEVSDVTANNTSYDTARVAGTAASTIKDYAGRAGTHLISTGLRTAINASTFTTNTVDTAGLYLTSTYVGYYNGSAWRSYFDNSGRCYFGDGGTTIGTDKFINWNLSDIVISANSGWIGSATNYFDIDNGKLHLAGTGGAVEIGGKTSYADSDAGAWIGMDGGTAKVNIGNANDYWKWDGTKVITSSYAGTGNYITLQDGVLNSVDNIIINSTVVGQEELNINSGLVELTRIFDHSKFYAQDYDSYTRITSSGIEIGVGLSTPGYDQPFVVYVDTLDKDYHIEIGDTSNKHIRCTQSSLNAYGMVLDYTTNAGTSSDTYKAFVHNGSGSAPSWQGRAITAYGSITFNANKVSGSDSGSVGWTIAAGSGTGYYTLTINSGTGNWIINASAQRVSAGNTTAINTEVNASGFFDNGTTDNIYMEGNGGGAVNKAWTFTAIRVS